MLREPVELLRELSTMRQQGRTCTFISAFENDMNSADTAICRFCKVKPALARIVTRLPSSGPKRRASGSG